MISRLISILRALHFWPKTGHGEVLIIIVENKVKHINHTTKNLIDE